MNLWLTRSIQSAFPALAHVQALGASQERMESSHAIRDLELLRTNCLKHVTRGPIRLLTNRDRMQHCFQIANIVQDLSGKLIQLRAGPQQHLGSVQVLLLQGRQIHKEGLVLASCSCYHVE